MFPRSPTTACRCEVDYTPLYPSFSQPLFPLQRKKSFSLSFSFFCKHPLPFHLLPTADWGIQTTTLYSQSLIVCARVSAFFPWHEEGNPVSICPQCLWLLLLNLLSHFARHKKWKWHNLTVKTFGCSVSVVFKLIKPLVRAGTSHDTNRWFM